MLALTPPLRRWCSAWLFFVLTTWARAAAPADGAPPSDEVGAAWQLMADHLGRDAYVRLDRVRGVPTREQRLAQAVVVVDYQPVTPERLHAAEAIFADLARGEDEIAAQAAYLQARLYQVHYSQPDYGRAAELYRALAARQPDSHWAQLGLVKLGLLQLYVLPEPAGPAARLAAVAALLPRIKEEKLQRDVHLQLGQAGTFYGLPLDAVLAHLIEVNRIGGLVGQIEEDLAIQLGELSLRAGHYAAARTYFETYLRDFTPNLRSVTVRRRLAEMAAQEAKAQEGRP